MMKANLPFLMCLRLSLHGRWVTRTFTILLSAMSFMFFGIASTGFTYSTDDLQFRAYKNYMEDKSYFLFMNDSSGYVSSEISGTDLLLSNEDVRKIESAIDLPFVSACRDQIDVGYFLDKSYFRGEKYVYDENGEIAGETEEYKAYLREVEGKPLDFSAPQVSVGSETAYEELSYRLLAGRYPEGVNEIAVSEEIFEHFVWGGYVDAIAEGCYTLQEFTFVFETYEAYAWDDSVIPPKEAGVKINSYEDLLGKTLGHYELKEENPQDAHETLPDEVVIVGIVDMSDRPAWPRRYLNVEPFSGILRSEAWLDAQCEAGKLYTEAMVARNFNKSDKLITDSLALTADLTSAAGTRYEGRIDTVQIGAYEANLVLDFKLGQAELAGIAFICGIGVVFLIFSILLNVHLITALMSMKRKQIGVLRALGAKEGQIERIFLTGTAVLAFLIFLVSTALTVAVYYTIWLTWNYVPHLGVSLFVFNGWNVLILAVFSFAVPLLSALVPLKRFLQKPIVDNISGNLSKR